MGKTLIDKIHRIVEDLGIRYLEHKDDSELTFGGKHYYIRPDCTYILPNKIVVFEIEKNIRPVESISKYWWLFKKTDWVSNNIKLICCIFLIERALDSPIRVEAVSILGEELEKLYPILFKFKCLTEKWIKECNLKELIRTLFAN